MKKYSCAVVTRTGRRKNNQDNFMLGGRYAEIDHDADSAVCSGSTSSPFLAVVADGMGGEASGERASFEACRCFAKMAGTLGKDFESNKSAVAQTIVDTNNHLCRIMSKEQCGRMGSTIAAILLQNDSLYYTNLGDSRIYLLRNGLISQITCDHTEGQSMVDAGILSAEQVKNHPSKHKLNRHLGIFPNEMTVSAVTYQDLKLHNGDKLLLCSDGISDAVEPDEMQRILSENSSVEARAAHIADAAYANGSRDNLTAMVVDVASSFPVTAVVIAAAGLIAAASAIVAIKALKGDNGSNTPITTEAPTAVPTEILTPEPTEIPAPEASGIQTEEPVITESGEPDSEETGEPDLDETEEPDSEETGEPGAEETSDASETEQNGD